MVCEFRLYAKDQRNGSKVIAFRYASPTGDVQIVTPDGVEWTIDRADLLKMLRAIGAAGGS